MSTEIFFLIDFVENIYLVTFSVLCGFSVMLYMIRDVLKFKIKNFARHVIYEVIIGVFAIALITGYLAYIIIPLVAARTIFTITFAAVLITVSILYAVPLFNKHPSNLFLTGVASGILVEMVFALVYVFILDFEFFIILAIFAANFSKVLFAMYLTRLEDAKKIDANYV